MCDEVRGKENGNPTCQSQIPQLVHTFVRIFLLILVNEMTKGNPRSTIFLTFMERQAVSFANTKRNPSLDRIATLSDPQRDANSERSASSIGSVERRGHW